MSDKLAYTIEEAADAVSVSVATIRRAIAATDPTVFPPPLRAKRMGREARAPYRITRSALTAWVESLQDA